MWTWWWGDACDMFQSLAVAIARSRSPLTDNNHLILSLFRWWRENVAKRRMFFCAVIFACFLSFLWFFNWWRQWWLSDETVEACRGCRGCMSIVCDGSVNGFLGFTVDSVSSKSHAHISVTYRLKRICNYFQFLCTVYLHSVITSSLNFLESLPVIA